MFKVKVQRGAHRPRSVKITSGSCRVGSTRDNDLVIKNRAVAKRHIELVHRADGVYSTDLGSTSGTWINHKRIREAGPLTEMDGIVIGDIHLRPDLSHLNTRSNISGPKPIVLTFLTTLSDLQDELELESEYKYKIAPVTAGEYYGSVLPLARINLFCPVYWRMFVCRGASDTSLSVGIVLVVLQRA